MPATPGADDLGMYRAYGLVYRLLQHDFRVYWLVNPTKDPSSIGTGEQPLTQMYTDRDVDFWLLSGGATPIEYSTASSTPCTGPACAPVLRIDQASMTAIPSSYNQLELPVRGSAFVIDSADRARFDEFIQQTGEFAFLSGTDGSQLLLRLLRRRALRNSVWCRVSIPGLSPTRAGVPRIQRRRFGPGGHVARTRPPALWPPTAPGPRRSGCPSPTSTSPPTTQSV